MTQRRLSHREKTPAAGLGIYLLTGFVLITLLVCGVGVWAATTEIAGAVIASGRVVVASNVKKVQHPTGGIVAEIHVKNGDAVAAGELLLRLDETITKANLQVVSKHLNELAMRGARLAAERDGKGTFNVPETLAARAGESEVKRVIEGELSLFASRSGTWQKQEAQLRERVSQLDEEIRGLDAQVSAKTREIELIAEELKGLEHLEAQELITTNRMVAMRREAARLEGERGQLQASVASAKGKIAEVHLQILSREQERQTEIVDELRQIESRQAELLERRITAEDQLKRVEIRAPQAGLVHQLAVHTVGGVINPAEPVLLIVPNWDRLVIEARVAPKDIDQLHVGQSALVRFAAFNQRTTPEVQGRVTSISADLSRDEITGEAFFLTRLALDETELERLDNNRLVPGMPADVQFRTRERTALSYLVKPFQDQLSKAFRER